MEIPTRILIVSREAGAVAIERKDVSLAIRPQEEHRVPHRRHTAVDHLGVCLGTGPLPGIAIVEIQRDLQGWGWG
jgi:hypothetical protein